MRKKKLIATGFIAIILLPLLLSGGLQVFQLYLKQRASYQLESQTLTDLKFAISDVQWIEEGREIMVDGKMYDLRTYHVENGFLIAKGIYDEEESRVMNFLNHFNDQEQNHLIIQVLLLVQTMASLILWISSAVSAMVFRRYFPQLLVHITPIYRGRIYHPPKQVLFPH